MNPQDVSRNAVIPQIENYRRLEPSEPAARQPRNIATKMSS
jgi:hypothetical protein